MSILHILIIWLKIFSGFGLRILKVLQFSVNEVVILQLLLSGTCFVRFSLH